MSVQILNQETTSLEAIGGKGNPPGISYKIGENPPPQNPDQGNNQGNNGGQGENPPNGNDQGNGGQSGDNSQNGGSNGQNSGNDNGSGSNNQGNDQGNNQGNNGGQNENPPGGGNQGNIQPPINPPVNPPAGGGGFAGPSRSSVRPDPFRSQATEINPQAVPLSQPATADAEKASGDLAEELKKADEVMSKFTDLARNHWAYESIREAAAKGYYFGTSDTTFSPNQPITRAEFIALLGRVLKVDASKEKNAYTDIKETDYFAGYAAWAYNKGYFVSDDKAFKPQEKMTREQIAVVLAKILKEQAKVEAKQTSYKDASSFSAEGKDSIDLVSSSGVLSGYANGNFGAKDHLTRAQLASIILRLEKALVK